MNAQRLRDDVEIGEEIIDIRHQAAHHAEPCMVMGVDQAWHDNAIGRIDDCGPVGLDVRADRRDALAFYQPFALSLPTDRRTSRRLRWVPRERPFHNGSFSESDRTETRPK
jgi:hypothetical protein